MQKINLESDLEKLEQLHSVKAEKMVLGAIIGDGRNGFIDIAEIITPDCFYLERHKTIFETASWMFEQSFDIDLVTLSQYLLKKGHLDSVGGAEYISELTNYVSSSSHIIGHAKILDEMRKHRQVLTAAEEAHRNAKDSTKPINETLDAFEQSCFAIRDKEVSASLEHVSSVVARTLKELEAIAESDNKIRGLHSGFPELDMLLNGFNPAKVYVVAARPGMGKSAFTLCIANNISILNNVTVAVFSLEMGNLETGMRILSIESEVDSSKINAGEMEEHEWQQIHSAAERLSGKKIFFDDVSEMTPLELKAKCRKIKMKHGLGAVIVDYIQLMTMGSGFKGNREQEISAISRSMKVLSKDLNVPVIDLSQLSRAVETRGGSKRPQLSDLRESGSIEQDADVVMFLYRPEYYNILEDEEGKSLKGIAEVIVAKNRGGKLKTVKMEFIDNLTKFKPIEFESRYQQELKSMEAVVPGSSVASNGFTSNGSGLILSDGDEARQAMRAARMNNEDIPF